ncbi:Two-component response regulator-like APRR5 [Acorus gramineus]|uniref:Two-component response regulator-like APRR5 n=1 Tax=Acorus gramineus TaxID=55184 RepID=A0AAV9BFG8_ACOGR|nr:Two-component response regulator-like APRR5 [Acorus gramineus]
MKATLSINKSITTENHREGNGIHNRVVGGDGDLGLKRCKEVVSDNHESFVGGTDFIKVRAAQCSIPVPERISERNGVICDATKSSHGRTACNFESSLSWELSLKRPELIGFPGHQQKHILNHSDASPFSRYGETPICLSCQKSGSSPENPSVKIKEYGHHCQTHQVIQETNNGKQPLFSEEESPCRKDGEFLKYHHLSSSSNQREADPIAVGPSREDAYVSHSSSKVEPDFSQHQVGFISLPVPVSAIPFQSLLAGYGSMLQHGLCPESSSPLCVTPSTKNQLLNSFHSIKFHHHVENYQPHDPEHRMVDQTVNMGPQDSGAAFFVNASGSNESLEAALNAGTGPENGNEGGLQYCTGNYLNSEHSRREAALTKFLLKRKDRCFKKKVRYHTRKKLAELRPRVKGQFVCQAVLDDIAASTKSNE